MITLVKYTCQNNNSKPVSDQASRSKHQFAGKHDKQQNAIQQNPECGTFCRTTDLASSTNKCKKKVKGGEPVDLKRT